MMIFTVFLSLTAVITILPSVTTSTGCVNVDTCASQANGFLNLYTGPFPDQSCSAYYWICPPTITAGICLQCSAGQCFNALGSTYNPGPGYPCAPCQKVAACLTTTTTTTAPPTTTTTAPPPNYGNELPNIVSKCSPSGVPVRVHPDIGVIVESPNYPVYYDYSANCVWNVIVYPQQYHTVRIYVYSPFDIRAGDILIVDNIAKYDSSPILMTARNFTIQLISDYTNSGKGFSFFIHGMSQPTTPAPPSTCPKTTCPTCPTWPTTPAPVCPTCTTAAAVTCPVCPSSPTTTPTPVKHAGIYLVGGFSPDYSTSVYKINPDERTIETFDIGSQYEGYMQAGALANGTIVFSSWRGPFIGYGLYNPSTNQVLSELPNIPNIHGHEQSSVVVTGPYLVNCGYNGTAGVSPCGIYNTLNGGLKIADVMEKKSDGCAVPFGDNRHILWIGGWTSNLELSNSVIKLDTETGTFSQVATMPQSRYAHSCALLGDVVVICGGYTNGYTSSCITLTLSSMTWGTFPSMTTPRVWFQLVNWKGQLLAIGGWNGNDLSSIEVYDGSAWSLLTRLTLPKPLAAFGAGVVNTP